LDEVVRKIGVTRKEDAMAFCIEGDDGTRSWIIGNQTVSNQAELIGELLPGCVCYALHAHDDIPPPPVLFGSAMHGEMSRDDEQSFMSTIPTDMLEFPLEVS
jgi:hypothetical protein